MPEHTSGAAAAAPSNTVNPWLAVFSVALSAAVFCSTEFLPVGLLRFVSQGLDVSEGRAGLMVSVPGVLAALSAPLLTVVAGRRDRRQVLWALGLLLVAANLTAMLAPNFGTLLFGRVLFGIGLGGFWAIGAGVGGRLVSTASAGRATAIIFAGVSIGMLIGGAAGALVGEVLGWRAGFGIAAGLSVLTLLAQLAFLPPLRVEQRIRQRDLLGIFATPLGRTGMLAMAFALYGQFAAYTYVTPLLSTQAGFGGKAISSILLGYTLIGLLGNFIGGAAAGRSVRFTLAASIAVSALSVLLLPSLGGSQAWALVLVIAWGLAYGAMPIALQMWMVKAAPGMHEAGMALFVANFQTSIALGSLMGGAVVDGLGLPHAFHLAGALCVVALLVIGQSSVQALTMTSKPPKIIR